MRQLQLKCAEVVLQKLAIEGEAKGNVWRCSVSDLSAQVATTEDRAAFSPAASLPY